MKPIAPLLLLAPLLACSDDGGRGTAASANPSTGLTTAPTTGDPGSSSDAPTSTTAATSTTDVTGGGPASATEAVKFDVANPKDLGETTGGKLGCDKVDFLFVIDNSASMEDSQAALIASFPGFIDAIENTLQAGSDYHIMVADSDDDGRCKQPCDLTSAEVKEFCAAKNYHACSAKLDACDTTRGAGVVHPVGLFSSNTLCPIAGGKRYMLPDEPDLLGSFACVAQVGTAGNASERPMNGMTEALALVGPGGCNEGFLRDDAILVVTFISDDPHYEDEGDPQSWYDAVVTAKQGNKDAVVVAGLIPLDDLTCVNAGQTNGTHWKQFVEMWGDHGILGSVCEMDYAPFFAQAVGIIDETCDNFVPPG